MKYIRRIAIGFALLVILVPMLILAVIFAVYHRAEPLEARNSAPPGQGIPIAETSLPGDDAMPQLARLVEPINKVVKTRDCLGFRSAHPLDWDCLNEVMTQGTSTLLAFEDWRSGPSLYKLEPPSDLGNHIRVPAPCFCAKVQTPDWTTFQSLSELLGYRALKRLKESDYEGAAHDLRTIFILGSFLQQNPILATHTTGISVYKTGLLVIARHVPPQALTVDYASLLPDAKLQVDAMRFALGAEWQGVQENVWQSVEEALKVNFHLPKNKFMKQGLATLGVYDHEQTLRLIAEPMVYALGHLNEGILANPPPGPQLDIYEPCPNDFLWLRNPIGRALACAGRIDWTKYNARTGQSIDKIEATRVVIAARLFMRDHNRWPTQVADLVPKYLAAWPLSALNGKPLRWLENKRGVQVLGPDGINPCKENELCEFAFEPSEAIKPARGTKPVRPSSKHGGYFPL